MSLATVAIVLALVALPGAAWAQAGRRSFGVGTMLGLGVSYNVVPSLSPPAVEWGPQAALPPGTLELRFFLPNGGSVDVYSFVGNTIVSGVLSTFPRRADEPGVLVFANLGVLYDANLVLDRRRRVYLLLGGGVEVGGDLGVTGSFDRTHPVKGTLRVPGLVGVELLDRSRRFGLQLRIRSFFEAVGYGRNDGREVVSPGFASLFETGVFFY